MNAIVVRGEARKQESFRSGGNSRAIGAVAAVSVASKETSRRKRASSLGIARAEEGLEGGSTVARTRKKLKVDSGRVARLARGMDNGRHWDRDYGRGIATRDGSSISDGAKKKAELISRSHDLHAIRVGGSASNKHASHSIRSFNAMDAIVQIAIASEGTAGSKGASSVGANGAEQRLERGAASRGGRKHGKADVRRVARRGLGFAGACGCDDNEGHKKGQSCFVHDSVGWVLSLWKVRERLILRRAISRGKRETLCLQAQTLGFWRLIATLKLIDELSLSYFGKSSL